MIDTTNVTPTVDNVTDVAGPSIDPVGDYQEKQNKKGWLWIALGVVAAFLCILFLWILPSKDKDKDGGPEPGGIEQAEAVSPVGENADGIEGIESTENAENAESAEVPGSDASAQPTAVSTPAAPAKEASPSSAQAAPAPAQAAPAPDAAQTAPAAAPAPSRSESRSSRHHRHSASTATATAADVTGTDREEALKVIRGVYGNASERKSILGNRYRKIQKRVNKMKRQGRF